MAAASKRGDTIQHGQTLGGTAAADLLGRRAVVFDTSGTVAYAGAGVLIDGVILYDVLTGAGITVFLSAGEARMIAGAAIARGDKLTPGATAGKLVTAAAGDIVCGKALEAAAADGDEVGVLLYGAGAGYIVPGP